MGSPSHASFKVRGHNVLKSIARPFGEIRLLGYDWILQWSHQNPSENSFTRKSEVSIGLKSLKGEENSWNTSFGIQLEGLSLITRSPEQNASIPPEVHRLLSKEEAMVTLKQ